MPVYEYLCQTCAYKFEVKQSIKDDPVATCRHCGKSVNRIISPPAILFKGSGWYITDYSDKLKPPSSEKTAGEKKDESVSASKELATSTATTSPTPTPTVASLSGGTSSSGSASTSR